MGQRALGEDWGCCGGGGSLGGVMQILFTNTKHVIPTTKPNSLLCHIINTNFFSPPRTPKMAQIIDGKKIAEDIRTELRTQIEQWVAEGHRAPQLTALLIGEDPASRTYVNNKMKVHFNNCLVTQNTSHLK